jgi:hypothetical protein
MMYTTLSMQQCQEDEACCVHIVIVETVLFSTSRNGVRKKCHDDLWKVWHSTTASHPITEYHIFMIRNAVLLSIQQGAESAALPALLRAENASC